MYYMHICHLAHCFIFAFQIMKEIFGKNSHEALCVGYDVSGIVKSVGSRVTSVKGGDEVVGKGFIIFNNEMDIVRQNLRILKVS